MIMVMIIAAPITKIAGEFDVCAKGENEKCLPDLMMCVKI
jgi:hypothetical protein